jgi:hypothetical protein
MADPVPDPTSQFAMDPVEFCLIATSLVLMLASYFGPSDVVVRKRFKKFKDLS